MKKEKILVEVAKLDGWETSGDPDFGEIVRLRKDGRGNYDHHPNYSQSRDAILSVIFKQQLDMTQWNCFFDSILEGVGSRNVYQDHLAILRATPLQLCIALLKAMGKWVEELVSLQH